MGKAVDRIEVDFFLVSVNNGQPKNENYDIMNSLEFPVENRQTRTQKQDDGLNYLAKNRSLSSLVKFSNLHFLLFISKRVDIGLMTKVAQCVRDGIPIPSELEAKVMEQLHQK